MDETDQAMAYRLEGELNDAQAVLREAADLLERWVAAMENPARWASPYSESVVLLPRLRAVLPQGEPTP